MVDLNRTIVCRLLHYIGLDKDYNLMGLLRKKMAPFNLQGVSELIAHYPKVRTK